MTDNLETKFTIHTATTLDAGDRWGIPDMPGLVGVLRSTIADDDTHVTLVADSEHAEMLTTAMDCLAGEILDSPSAILWMRLGWPEEWATPCEPNAWLQCQDGHAADPRHRSLS